MCLAVGTPLVESGTAGYLGQCTAILPRRTECYDCTAKEAPKTFAVCTIRSTPSAPIHCVVWAKDYLLPNLFGEQQEESIPEEIFDDTHIASLKKETEAFTALREMAASADPQYSAAVFRKVFHQDIEAIRTITSLWESRPAPRSIDLGALNVAGQPDFASWNDQDVWSLEQWTTLLFASLARLAQRAFPAGAPSVNAIAFDKDDQDTLNFVSAVANLRAHVYGIAMTSRFALKAIAGNIIPAIATTNAIAAGMIVLQAKNILAQQWSNVSDMFITSDPSRRSFFLKVRPEEPSTACSTCFAHRGLLKCNPVLFRLGDVIDRVVPKFLQRLGDPEATTEYMSVLEGARMIYDEEDMPQHKGKTLAALGAADSRFLRFQFQDGLPLLLAIQMDDSFSKGEFGVTFDLVARDMVELGRKRAHSVEEEDGSSSDLEVLAEDRSDSDLEILEPSATRVKA